MKPAKELPPKELVQRVKEAVIAQCKDLPQYSVFGDDNWHKRDEMLRLLDGYLSGTLTESSHDHVDDADSECYHLLDWLEGNNDGYEEEWLV